MCLKISRRAKTHLKTQLERLIVRSGKQEKLRKSHFQVDGLPTTTKRQHVDPENRPEHHFENPFIHLSWESNTQREVGLCNSNLVPAWRRQHHAVGLLCKSGPGDQLDHKQRGKPDECTGVFKQWQCVQKSE